MDERLIEHIRRVSALRESPNEQEAANAAAILARLLQEHNLTMSDIKGKDTKAKPEVILGGRIDYGGQSRMNWKVKLAGMVARVTFCDIIWHSSNHQISFLGRPEDLEICTYIYEQLAVKIESLANAKMREFVREYKRQWGEKPRRGENNPRVWRLSWTLGALSTVKDTLDREFRVFQNNPNAFALVVVRGNEVAEARQRMFPRLGHKKLISRHYSNDGAEEQGRRDGRSITVNRGLGSRGGSRPLQLGGGE